MRGDDGEFEAGGEEQGFVQRWSRRKQQAEGRSELAESPEPDPPAEPPAPLTDADMPPLESLTEASDFSGFLSSGVSEELRRLALRKLFHSAAFNVRDGLNDYDEDFTTFEKLGDIVTAEMRHRAEQEARRLAEAAAETAEAPQERVETAAEPVPIGSDVRPAAVDPRQNPAPANPGATDPDDSEDRV